MTTVLTVTDTKPVEDGLDADPPTTVGRLGPLFAGIWLFFLLNPLLEGWARRDEVRGIVGMICTVAFAVVYMSLWVRAH